MVLVTCGCFGNDGVIVITNILHVSRQVFHTHPWEKYSDKNLACICIRDPDTEPEKTTHFKYSLHVNFWDTTPVMSEKTAYPCASPTDLDEIAHFIQELAKDDRPWELVVHCEAGISRSAAVAVAVVESYPDLVLDFQRAQHANPYIRRELLRRLRNETEINGQDSPQA